MHPLVRSILAVLGGLLAAFVVIGLVEAAGVRFYPPPPGMDPRDPKSIRAVMANLPRGALLCVLVAYAAGSVVGGWVAARFAPSAKLTHGMVVGALLLAAGVLNMSTIPHPGWFWISSIAIYLLGTWSGARAAGAGRRAA
jgi:hypothetical protein